MRRKTIRRGLAILLCMAMLLSLPALAVYEEDEIQEIPVVSETDVVAELPELPVEAPFDDGSLGEQAQPMASTVFSVTVPTTVAIHMDASGGITCGDIVITNNSTDAVLIKDTQVSALNGWTLVDYATTTFTDANKGQHKVALQLSAVDGAINANGGSKTIGVAAKLPYQGIQITNAAIAQVAFVLGWYETKPTPSEGLVINGENFVDLGYTIQLSATKEPDNTMEIGTISWISSDISVAPVSSTGIVTGKGIGTATITATCNGFSATKNIRVYTPVTNIEFECADSSGFFFDDNCLYFDDWFYDRTQPLYAKAVPEAAFDGRDITITINKENTAHIEGNAIYLNDMFFGSCTQAFTISCGSFSKTYDIATGH